MQFSTPQSFGPVNTITKLSHIGVSFHALQFVRMGSSVSEILLIHHGVPLGAIWSVFVAGVTSI